MSAGSPVLPAGSITHLKAEVGGAVVLTGSHGGTFVAAYALRLGAGALICHDAGFGLERAGIAGLAMLDEHDIPAAAVGHDSARIGDAGDMQARGRISAANRAARALGVREGQACRDTVARLAAAVGRRPGAQGDGRDGAVAAAQAQAARAQAAQAQVAQAQAAQAQPLDGQGDHRHVLGKVRCRLFPEPVEIVCLDSASDITDGDAGKVVLTGSHGGLPAGETASAVKAGVRLVAFNDAGVGVDRAGIARLPVLDGLGIPGIAVAAASARIGDGRSTYGTGRISHVNALARELGIAPGATIRDILRPAAG